MDDAQLRHMLEAHHGDNFGWALCCCRRDRARAEEVLQSAYLKVLDGRARFDAAGGGSFRTWLFAVIRRTAIDLRRREWLAHLRLVRYVEHQSPSVRVPQAAASEIEQDDWRRMFLEALAGLSDRQREVLHLVFYHGLSLADAAKVMSIGLGSARVHYDRGKKALRRHFEKKGVLEIFMEKATDGSGSVPTLA